MRHTVIMQPAGKKRQAIHGENLLQWLRAEGIFVEAPCGGKGTCGKCKVIVDGKTVSACRVSIEQDIAVELPGKTADVILSAGAVTESAMDPVAEGMLLAFDIGTTTVVGYLLDDKTGKELALCSKSNPQAAFGADVISRIGHALKGEMENLTGCIRSCVLEITQELCQNAGIDPNEIGVVCVVGNPAMQQLFLGISPENLAKIPFAPVLTRAQTVSAAAYLPVCGNAKLLIVPDISGFVGADTLACVLSTGLDRAEEWSLLVDIGTNGEMVLGNRDRMVACSTAAGPALEGANISCGMRGKPGAIDHVWLENGALCYSVICGVEAEGICGSGLIDAVAAALEGGWINARGKILLEEPVIRLSERVSLTQEDIRQVQTAKGAIAAGIHLMAEHMGIRLEEIQRVYLAGAFGTFMDPASACRIGLLPKELEGKILRVGNAAGSGAKQMACSARALDRADTLTKTVEFLELATLPAFRRRFAEHMRF
jgi:uncharacterized 2Fe-2S/4Fe-4S cluster protein (DUF4445 family)